MALMKKGLSWYGRDDEIPSYGAVQDECHFNGAFPIFSSRLDIWIRYSLRIITVVCCAYLPCSTAADVTDDLCAKVRAANKAKKFDQSFELLRDRWQHVKDMKCVFNFGLASRNLSKHDIAVSAFKKVLQNDSKDLEAAINFAHSTNAICGRLPQDRQADCMKNSDVQNMLRFAIENNPTKLSELIATGDGDFVANYAQAFISPKFSLAIYKAEISKNPNNDSTLVGFSNAAITAGEQDFAVPVLQKVVADSPGNFVAAMFLARLTWDICNRLPRDRQEECRNRSGMSATLIFANRKNPKKSAEVVANGHGATLAFVMDMFVGADTSLPIYELEIEKNPTNANTLTYYGFALAKSRRCDKAITVFQRAVQILPALNEQELWFGQTIACMALTKSYQDIVKWYLKDPSAFKRAIFPLYHVGMAYFYLKQPLEAKRVLDEQISLLQNLKTALPWPLARTFVERANISEVEREPDVALNFYRKAVAANDDAVSLKRANLAIQRLTRK